MNKKSFFLSLISFIIICILSSSIVVKIFFHDSNMMSYLGGVLGGVFGGIATIIAIYFTIISLRQDVMPLVIPIRTVYYGYYSEHNGIHFDKKYNNVEDIKMDLFHTCYMNIANIGKDAALNVKLEWDSAFNSELYDIMLDYGIPQDFFGSQGFMNKKETLLSDFIVTTKMDTDNYKIEIPYALTNLFKHVMNMLLGKLDSHIQIQNNNEPFVNNFINKKQLFSKLKISYEDLNGYNIIKTFDIYSRIDILGETDNGNYEVMKIELSTFSEVN